MTFLSLISWLDAARCAPDLLQRRVKFVKGGDCDADASISSVGAGL